MTRVSPLPIAYCPRIRITQSSQPLIQTKEEMAKKMIEAERRLINQKKKVLLWIMQQLPADFHFATLQSRLHFFFLQINFPKTLFLECHSSIQEILYIKSTLLCQSFKMSHNLLSLYLPKHSYVSLESELFILSAHNCIMIISPSNIFSGYFLAIN